MHKKQAVPTARKRKDQTIKVRVTTEQRQAMQRAADAAGLDLSSWLRSVGTQAAAKA